MTEFSTLTLTYDDPIEKVAKITFDRPKSLNALNSHVIRDLELAISELEINDRGIRALVVTGAGKAFVAGADISEMSNMTPPEARNFLYSAQQVLNRLEQLPFPVIAQINGYALGGGLEVALACDIRIASDQAVIGLPEVSLGIIPSAGGTQRLTRLVGPGVSKYLILTAKRLNAEEALNFNIINEVVAHEELFGHVIELLTNILNLAPIALASAKRSIEVADNEPLRSGLEIELNNAVECFQSEDLREGMKAFLEKRKAEFSGR